MGEDGGGITNTNTNTNTSTLLSEKISEICLYIPTKVNIIISINKTFKTQGKTYHIEQLRYIITAN